jgi:AraC-like DNA-binding protein
MIKESLSISRPQQIQESFIQLIDQHLDDLVHSRSEQMFEIEHFAELMFIHPTHLSNTIKELTGGTPCGIFQSRILVTAKQLLSDESLTIRRIAFILSFEPSQFSKWFKKFAGISPKDYRKLAC